MNTHVLAETKPSKTSAQAVRSHFLQRKCACGGTPGLTGECEKCRKKRLQREARNSELGIRSDLSVPPIVHEVLRQPGQPLDASTRAFMESRFGHDFSRVRVHTDGRAERAARTIGSEAYTIGSDIAFAAGHFNSTRTPAAACWRTSSHTWCSSAARPSPAAITCCLGRGDPGERAADAAAEAVLTGRHVPQQPALRAATVARKPAGTTKAADTRPGFLIHVVVDEPVNGHEFCVRAIMQGHRIGREETEHLLATGRLRCYGSFSIYGVRPDWVGHPIPFRIGADLFGERVGATPTTPDPAEKAEVDAETNKRFWERIGEKRILSKNAPEDAAYRELWKAEREQVLWERHDPFGPELRQFAAIGNLPAAASADEIHPWELDAMLEVKTMLAHLNPRDWIRLRRIGLPQTNWQGLAEWLPKFIAQQRADEKVVERVRELDKMGGLASAYGTVHGAGAGSMDPAAPQAFERRDELEQAGKDFRAMFRTRALEKAVETFRGVNAIMDAAANRPFPSRDENNQLYALLQSGKGPEDLSEDVLRRYPVLRDPTTFRVARNTMYASDLGSYLTRRAAECAKDTKYLVEHIGEKPEAVFNFKAIVNATLQELGLDDSLYPQVLEWGKPDGSSLFSTLLHLGLFVMLFIPGLDVIAMTVFAGEAAIGSYTEIRNYNEELKKWNRGERADSPSPWGVIGAGVNFGLSVVPFAHGLGRAKGVVGAEGLLEQGGRIERLAGETKTLGSVESAVEGRAAAVEGEIAGASDVPSEVSKASPSVEPDVPGPHPSFKKPAPNENQLLPPEGQIAERPLARTGTSATGSQSKTGYSRTAPTSEEDVASAAGRTRRRVGPTGPGKRYANDPVKPKVPGGPKTKVPFETDFEKLDLATLDQEKLKQLGPPTPEQPWHGRLEGEREIKRTIGGLDPTDIDIIDNGFLLERKTAVNATDRVEWIRKEITVKYENLRLLRAQLAREYPEYEQALIGFRFEAGAPEEEFLNLIYDAIEELQRKYGIRIPVEILD